MLICNFNAARNNKNDMKIKIFPPTFQSFNDKIKEKFIKEYPGEKPSFDIFYKIEDQHILVYDEQTYQQCRTDFTNKKFQRLFYAPNHLNSSVRPSSLRFQKANNKGKDKKVAENEKVNEKNNENLPFNKNEEEDNQIDLNKKEMGVIEEKKEEFMMTEEEEKKEAEEPSKINENDLVLKNSEKKFIKSEILEENVAKKLLNLESEILFEEALQLKSGGNSREDVNINIECKQNVNDDSEIQKIKEIIWGEFQNKIDFIVADIVKVVADGKREMIRNFANMPDFVES